MSQQLLEILNLNMLPELSVPEAKRWMQFTAKHILRMELLVMKHDYGVLCTLPSNNLCII